MRKNIGFCSFLLVLALCASGVTTRSQPYPRPRFTMPDGQHPGWIDLQQYLEIEDPVEAGRLLLKESRAVGMNLDDSSNVWKQRESVRYGNGTVTASDAYEFMRKVRAENDGENAELTAYLFHLRRWPTIREMSAALMQGIHFCGFEVNGATIMAARATSVRAMTSLPYVRWLSPLQPEFKYDPGELAGGDSVRVYVRALAGLHDYCRKDLERCGARSIYQGSLAFEATIPTESAGCIARLWWVLGIERYNEPVDD